MYFRKNLFLPFKKSTCRYLLPGMCFLFMLAACEFRPNVQGEGEVYLQGSWKQDSMLHQDKLLAYSLYEMRFTCDSVYITIETYNRVPSLIDSCAKDGYWKEYARGVYIVRNDTLMVEADFTFSNGKQKLSGCFGQGQFLPKFALERHTEDSLYLRTQYTAMPLRLRKIAESTCIPQPLGKK